MVSDSSHDLVWQLNQLQEKRTWLGHQPSDENILSLLAQITDQDKPVALLPSVVRFLFFHSDSVRVAACQAIHRLLSSAPPESLLDLYSLMGSWYMPPPWSNLVPSQVKALIAEESCRSSVLGLASFHHNGYVRHEAVRLLTAIRDGSELPYLLMRQNDWVKPISSEARDAVWERVRQDYLFHFVSSLSLVLSLLRFSRYDHSALVQRVVEMLIQPQHQMLLASLVQSPQRAIRRKVVRIVLDLAGEHRGRIVKQGLASEDAVLRLWCSREVSSIASGEELKILLNQIKHDSFMSIRKEGFRIEAEAFPESALAVWQEALLDRHSSIRQLAQFQIRKIGHFDLAQFYRDALATRPDSVAAIGGLGETGDSSDLLTILPYLKSPLPSRRRVAVRSLANLGGDSAVEELIEGLKDCSPSVVREVRRQLREHLHLVAGEQLLDILNHDHRPHVRSTALELIFEMSKWRSLPWLIRALDHEDQKTVEKAEELIAAWFLPPLWNKVFTTPSDSERQAIEQALAQSRPAIEDSFYQKLRYWLDRS